MKFLKRFESKEEIDIDYLNNCFIEFIDDGAKPFKSHLYNVFFMEIEIKLPRKPRSSVETIDSILNEINFIESKLLDIKNCIEKIKIEYPSLSIEIDKLDKKYKAYKIFVKGDQSSIFYDGTKQVIDIPFPSHWNVKTDNGE